MLPRRDRRAEESFAFRPCRITATLGAETEQVRVEVANGVVSPSELVVHFPIPMARAWDNVVFTCSMMLLFRDEGAVDAWCAEHHLPRGDVQPIDTVLELAKRWYGDMRDAIGESQRLTMRVLCLSPSDSRTKCGGFPPTTVASDHEARTDEGRGGLIDERRLLEQTGLGTMG